MKKYTKSFIIDAVVRVVVIIVGFVLIWNTENKRGWWIFGYILLLLNVITMFFDPNYSNKKNRK